MFIPPYRLILEHVGQLKKNSQEELLVISKEFLEFLLLTIINMIGFDEKDYLAKNPDVHAGIKDGTVQNAKDHFLRFGYLEGRVGGINLVDENWYQTANPDVSKAIARKEFRAGTDHYVKAGANEWRSPNKGSEAALAAWKKVLERQKRLTAAASDSKSPANRDAA